MTYLKPAKEFGCDFLVDPLWCAWFSGIVDGEGCFSLRIQGNSCSAELKISMREDEDKIIKEIQSTLQCGRVGYLSNRAMRFAGGNGRDAIAFRVKAINEVCGIIIPLLDAYPLKTRKLQSYLKWRKGALLVREKAHVSGRLQELYALKQDLETLGKTRANTNAFRHDILSAVTGVINAEKNET